MPGIEGIGKEACVSTEADERERAGGGEVRGNERRSGAGAVKEAVEANTMLRKGKKRPQKIKWFVCGVN